MGIGIFKHLVECNLCDQIPCTCSKDPDPKFEREGDAIPQTYEPDPSILKTIQAVNKKCTCEKDRTGTVLRDAFCPVWHGNG